MLLTLWYSAHNAVFEVWGQRVACVQLDSLANRANAASFFCTHKHQYPISGGTVCPQFNKPPLPPPPTPICLQTLHPNQYTTHMCPNCVPVSKYDIHALFFLYTCLYWVECVSGVDTLTCYAIERIEACNHTLWLNIIG